MRGIWRAYVVMEERLLRAAEQQALPRTRTLVVGDGRCHARVHGLLFPCIHVPQDAEQDGDGGKPLKSIHDVEYSVRPGSRPTGDARGRAVIALDEQHGAEEVVAAVSAA